MKVRYNYRIYPTEQQKEMIHKTCGSVRFVWNHFLALEMETYNNTKKFNFFNFNSKQLPALKQKFEWLQEPSYYALQQELMKLNETLVKSFKKKSGFPKFKKKKELQGSYQICAPSNNIRILNKNTINLPKLGYTKIKLDRKVPSKIGTTTIIWDDTRYYVSLVVEIPDLSIPIQNIPKNRAVGVDLGLTDFATTSDGEIIHNPRFLKKHLRRLKIRQRRLSRTKKGSKNRLKRQSEVRAIHRKIKDKRKGFHYETAIKLLKYNDLICFENLNISGLAKGKLAKSIYDVGWRQFIEITKWLALKQGKTVVQIGRFEPSTKTCNSCGHKQVMRLDQRHFWCDMCYHNDSRDHNAAMNILDWGYDLYSTGGMPGIYDQKAEKAKALTAARSRKTSKSKASLTSDGVESEDLSGKSFLEESS